MTSRPISMALLPAFVAILAGCSSAPPEPGRATRAPSADLAALARVVETPSPLECVPYARRLSNIDLRGDAWTWWESAAGLYERSATPKPGAVLVIKRQRNTLGHLAVVSRVLDERIILADHANWLNRGRIFRDTPIMDVSKAGDWSAVRVWYPPGRTWGKRVYLANGFIHRERTLARSDATP